MANTTFYERGNAYHNSAGNPAIIKNGNELTFTDNFNVGGGGGTPYTPPAYSTEEHLTGRKWIDGRDIYEKTILLENVTITANQGIVVGDNFGIDKTINAILRVESENGTASIGLWINGNSQIVFQSPTSYAHGNVYVTIQYTKVTPAETNNTRTVKKSTSKKG